MKTFVTGRLALTLFFVAVFVLCQFIPMKGTAKVNCSLFDPGPPTTYFKTSYGVPVPIILTLTEGCYENQTTNIVNFSIEGLLVDILFGVVLGIIPYLSFSLLQRFRRHNNVE